MADGETIKIIPESRVFYDIETAQAYYLEQVGHVNPQGCLRGAPFLETTMYDRVWKVAQLAATLASSSMVEQRTPVQGPMGFDAVTCVEGAVLILMEAEKAAAHWRETT